MESYSDFYRLLSIIIIVISLWFIFELLMKFVFKIFKKKKESAELNNNNN